MEGGCLPSADLSSRNAPKRSGTQWGDSSQVNKKTAVAGKVMIRKWGLCCLDRLTASVPKNISIKERNSVDFKDLQRPPEYQKQDNWFWLFVDSDKCSLLTEKLLFSSSLILVMFWSVWPSDLVWSPGASLVMKGLPAWLATGQRFPWREKKKGWRWRTASVNVKNNTVNSRMGTTFFCPDAR